MCASWNIPVSYTHLLALGADFLGTDGMGNLGAKHLDFAAVGLPQQGGDLLGKVGAVVHHRQQYAVDLELGVDLPLHLVYGLEQLFQALGGQVLRLDGDYDPVGGGQGLIDILPGNVVVCDKTEVSLILGADLDALLEHGLGEIVTQGLRPVDGEEDHVDFLSLIHI